MMRCLLLVAFCAVGVGADPAALKATLGKKGHAGLLEQFAAVEKAAASGDASLVPVLFRSAIESYYPAYAVAAGEAANGLDPKAAIRAYDQVKSKLKGLASANAVRFVAEIRGRQTAARLTDAAKSNQVETRVEALYGLVKQGEKAGHASIVSGLKSRNHAVKVPAAVCAGLARVPAAVPLLLRGLEDTKADYAWYCAWALGQLKDPGLLARVVAAAKGRLAGDVGEAKAKAVVECAFDPAHAEVLIRLLRHTNRSLVAAAAWGLGNVGQGNADAAAALLTLVQTSREDRLAHIAVDALGRIGGPTEGAKIHGRFGGNPGRIAGHDIKAIGLLKTAGAGDLLLAIAYKNRKTALRKRAAIAFWQCADEAERKKFQDRLQDAKGGPFAAGCLVLGFDRSASGFEFAVQLLRKHYGRKTARLVRDALERMTGHRFSPEPGIWNQWFKKNSDFFTRKPQLLDRKAWRQQLRANKLEMGISKETEEAVERGLAWLSRHQSLDGRWVGDKFYDRCSLYHRKKCQIGARLGGWDVGMSGIALLAFYGAGYRPGEGRYKDAVLRAQVFCAARQWADGDFGGQGDLIGGYTRPIGTIALAEAYGTGGGDEYYERAWRSVAQLVRIQYDDAGWRYRLSGQAPGDTSVTGWNAWAIATARKFGIPVDPMGLEGSNSLIDSFSSPVTQDEEFYDHDPRYFFDVGRGMEFEHFTGYNARDNSRPPMTAIGLICKIFMGRERSHPYCIGAANRLLKSIPEYDERTNKIKYTTGAEYPSYYWYYGSLAMYQMGGRFWRRWSRPLLTEAMPKAQIRDEACEHGSWDADNLDSIGGRVYTTAMCVLTLETFYRYLPSLSLK